MVLSQQRYRNARKFDFSTRRFTADDDDVDITTSQEDDLEQCIEHMKRS